MSASPQTRGLHGTPERMDVIASSSGGGASRAGLEAVQQEDEEGVQEGEEEEEEKEGEDDDGDKNANEVRVAKALPSAPRTASIPQSSMDSSLQSHNPLLVPAPVPAPIPGLPLHPAGQMTDAPYVFSNQAPRLRIPRQVYNSVEYPGYITSSATGENTGLSVAPNEGSVEHKVRARARGGRRAAPPTKNPAFVRALYTLGVRPDQIEALALPTAQPSGMVGYTTTPLDACFNASSSDYIISATGAGVSGGSGTGASTGTGTGSSHHPSHISGRGGIGPGGGLELNWRPKTRGLVVPIEIGGGVAAGGVNASSDNSERVHDPNAMEIDDPDTSTATRTQRVWPAGENLFSRPIQGERVPVGRMLVRVVMRRKRKRASSVGGQDVVGVVGTDLGLAVAESGTAAGDMQGDAVEPRPERRSTRSSRVGTYQAAGEELIPATDPSPIKAQKSTGKGKAVTFADDDPSAAAAGIKDSVPSDESSGSREGVGNTSSPASDVQKQKDPERGGVFKLEIVGIIKNTVRWRGMADYQYTPFKADGQISALVEKLAAGDAQSILDFKIAELNETYFVPIDPSDESSKPLDPARDALSDAKDGDVSKFKSTMYGASPGLFSRQIVPHSFDYMPNPSSREIDVVDPLTGRHTTRLINMHRVKFSPMLSIRADDSTFPKEASPEIKRIMNQLDQTLLRLLAEKFKERPVWQRFSLINQFTPLQQKELSRDKAYFPSVSYSFANGLLKAALVRFGYDPRTDPESYQYQRVFFRYDFKTDGLRANARRDASPDTITRPIQQTSGELKENAAKTHIFDGVELYRSQGTYQLCDITDPWLAKFVHDPKARGETFDLESGWFKAKQWHALKGIIRARWIALSVPDNAIKVADAEEGSDHMQDLILDFHDYNNVLGMESQATAAGRMDDEDEDAEGDAQDEDGDGAVLPQPLQRRPPRPRGRVKGKPVGTRNMPDLEGARTADRWRIKSTGNMPIRAEDQEALRLRALLERQRKEDRQARRRDEREE